MCSKYRRFEFELGRIWRLHPYLRKPKMELAKQSIVGGFANLEPTLMLFL